MAGLNKIIERIAQDSAVKCDGIIFDAQNEAAKIKEAAIVKADNEKESILANAKKEENAIIDMAESGAELDSKKLILSTKVELIEKAIDAALEKLNAMPDEEYFAAIYALVKKYAQAAKGEMVLSKKDLGRIPGDFEKKINTGLPKGAKLTLSKKPGNISNGFILVYGDIEINCTFEALIAEKRDEIKDELYGIIFA